MRFLLVLAGWVWGSAILFGQAKSDSAVVALLVKEPAVSLVKYGNELFAIGGSDSSSVYRVKGNKIQKIMGGENFPAVKFSSLMVSGKGKLLACTPRHYVYGWHRGKVTRFDFNKGLTDSLVVGFEGMDARERPILKTQRRNFVFEEGRDLVRSRFKYTKSGGEAPPPIGSAQIIRQSVQEPINKAICFLFADIDYSFKRHKAIRGREIKEIEKMLAPGDILVKRNDYQLSNLGISGFWSHCGIYLGDFDRLDEFFKDVPMLQGKKASEYIKSYNFGVYHRLSNKRNMIIEAVGEGVCINPLENIAKVDYLAAMRPQLSREDIFKSLLVAFDYLGFPYDYLFDFSNDDELVCSELVYRAFSSGGDKKGMLFQMKDRYGKNFLFPNDLGVQCCAEAGIEEKNLGFVLFCGIDATGKKVEFKTIDQFARTVGN
ncbi:MAG: YiiX/YebB-like N1pC/P60 family cysteine hydrolase [Breznakibacter sp.]